MKDRETNRSRGFGKDFLYEIFDSKHSLIGFVSYDNAQSALMAVQRMNGFQTPTGKRLKVDIKKGEDEDGPTNAMPSSTKFNPY